nr:hypothetical protein L204_05323 [Cryptococcus depauperatus CBS 7855]
MAWKVAASSMRTRLQRFKRNARGQEHRHHKGLIRCPIHSRSSGGTEKPIDAPLPSYSRPQQDNNEIAFLADAEKINQVSVTDIFSGHLEDHTVNLWRQLGEQSDVSMRQRMLYTLTNHLPKDERKE